MSNTPNASPAEVTPEDDDLEIPQLDDEFFKNAVVGKHYEAMMSNSNVVRIAPDLRHDFPNEQAVNDALRTLVQLRRLLTPTSRSAGPSESRKQTA